LAIIRLYVIVKNIPENGIRQILIYFLKINTASQIMFRNKKLNIKEIIYIALIILAASLIRFIYYKYQPEVLSAPDGHEYYNMAVKYRDNISLSTLFTPLRPPLYPVFLALIADLTIGPRNPISFSNYPDIMDRLALFQTIFSILGCLLVYFIFRKSGLPPSFSFLGSIIHSFNLILIPYDKIFLTESLSIFGAILFVWAFIRFINKQTLTNSILLLLIASTAITLRWAFLSLLPLLLVFFILFNNKLKTIAISAFCLGLFILVLVAWKQFNFKNYGFDILSVYSPINVFGRILKDDIPVENTSKTNPNLYQFLVNWRKLNSPKLPYQFLMGYDYLYFKHPQTFSDLESFNRNIILGNFPAFALHALSDAPRAYLDKNSYAELKNPDLTGLILKSIQLIFYFLQLIFLIIIPLYLILFIYFLPKKISGSLAIALTLGLSGYIQIFVVGSILAYEDYSRLSIPFMPMLFMSFWIMIYLFIKNKNIFKKYA
jgi:hypothetical protein